MSEISKRLEKAEKLFQKGKHDLALDEYLSILRDEPNNDKVRQHAADLCVSLNRSEQAATLLGPLFDRQVAIGDTGKAILTYKRLARLTAPTVDRSFRFAEIIERSNRREALEAYEVSLTGFADAGRKTEAMSVLDRLVALDPSLVNYIRQGELANEIGDKKKASHAFYSAGQLEVKSGGDGLPKFERAFSLDPANTDVALAYARALLARGEAAKLVSTVEPLLKVPGPAQPEFRDLYGRALLLASRPVEALPYIWELFQRDPRHLGEVTRLIGLLLDAGQFARAIEICRKAEAVEHRAGRRREFVLAMRNAAEQHRPGIEFLEYMVELYNTASREHDYCNTLMKLFDLYYVAGNFSKAANALDRAADVDPYEPGHVQRLQSLRGKIESDLYSSISHRFSVAGVSEDQVVKSRADDDSQPTILEDFMLQAEIFLQYSMRAKAIERLERLAKMFPYEEEKNPRLRQLYLSAGFVPNYQGVPRPTGVPTSPAKPAPAAAPAAVAAAPGAAADDTSHIDNIARITDITRNIYRQGNVKSVLFTTVNEVGRHWDVSRCVAGLCTPGKPPSAALEYCAPSVKQSEVTSVVRLIGILQGLMRDRNALVVPNTAGSPELASCMELLQSLDIQALLAVPLLDGEQNVGILILEQCGAPRPWGNTDVVVLKTIADQVAQAFQNARLRSLVRTLAVHEEASGLLKRASYLDVLVSEVRRAAQQNSTITVMLFNFGKAGTMIKEAGEALVDAAIQQVGQVVCSHLRQSDLAVRYELTTIAVLLADTGEKNAFFVVDKVRKVLSSMKSPGSDRLLAMTVGIAEAAIQPGFDPIDIVTEVINRAEQALAAAQAEGGNCARSLPPISESAAVA